MNDSNTYHHGNLKQALIDAGAELIEQKGIAALSLRAVAKQAGVSHAAPYRHFKDKNAMLCGIAETGFSRLGQCMMVAIQAHAESPGEQLVAAGVAYVELAIDYPQWHNLMFGGVLSNEVVDDGLEEASNMAFQALVNIIIKGQEQGLFKAGESSEMALSAWSIVHGFAMLASTGGLDHLAADKAEKLALASRIAGNLVSGLSTSDV